MTRDPRTQQETAPSSIRAAVLDLMAGRAGGALQDEEAFDAALRQIVAGGCDRAGELWQLYRGSRCDRRGRVFARYAD